MFVWLHRFLFLLWKNFSPLFFTLLRRFLEVCRLCFCTTLLRFRPSTLIKSRSGLYADHSSILILLVLGNFFYFMIQFSLSFSCQTDDLSSECLQRRSWSNQGLWGVLVFWLQNKPSALHQIQLVWGVNDNMLRLFFPNMMLRIMDKHIYFRLNYKKQKTKRF